MFIRGVGRSQKLNPWYIAHSAVTFHHSIEVNKILSVLDLIASVVNHKIVGPFPIFALGPGPLNFL